MNSDIDKQKMFKIIEEFTSQFKVGFNSTKGVGDDLKKGYSNIIIAGMGGSALAGELFWRHVRCLALYFSFGRTVNTPLRARDAEVDDLDRALETHEDVPRRHIAVNNLHMFAGLIDKLMGGVESFSRLRQDVGDA